MAFRREVNVPGEVAVIVVAAGRGTRMESDRNKVLLPIKGIPILARTVKAFSESGMVHQFLIVIGEEDRLDVLALLEKWCPDVPVKLIYGGAERQESVHHGLMALAGNESVVLIHDGARPFIGQNAIRACIQAVWTMGAACVGVPVKDTIKRVDMLDMVIETPDRAFLWQVQTPQGFKPDIILKAHQQAVIDGFRGTDDAMLVERMGMKVRMIMGGYGNLKITTPEDIAFAEALLGE
jgi:2-C-methyl-D-erythritol 4-phosphate cytidylyltransferase